MTHEERESVGEELTAATGACREACRTFVGIFDKHGESLIGRNASPRDRDIALRLFANARVMLGILTELNAAGRESRTGALRESRQ